MLIENQMKYHELQANWWINAATNGYTESREIYHGTNGHKFTKEECKNDAMKTAQTHIRLYGECAEHLQKESEHCEIDKLLEKRRQESI